MKRRRGFTLIELMIAAAAGVILLTAVFSVNFRITDLWRSERVRQALQQNFRFAGDAMVNKMRQATVVLQPADNSFGDVLQFYYIKTPSPSQTTYSATYRRVGTGPYHIECREVQVVVDVHGVWTEELGTATVVPVTEDISSLAALHFVRRGSRVVTIMVAEYVSGGADRTISYTLQTSVRTLQPPT
jgi:prepilin-type N-terminal cleavage/methylation domain-containing protein